MVYLDNSATTKISDEVFEAALPYLKDGYGNPSSVYKIGREAAVAVAAAREKTAAVLNAEPREVYFTSGGSESDNWAIRKAVSAAAAKRGGYPAVHIITTVFEHHAVLHTFEELEKRGVRTTYLPVYENGIVKPRDLLDAITDDTVLVSVMYANNEIGTVQPIAQLGGICRERGVLCHVDAVQACGYLPIDVKRQNIDLLSLSGHKIHSFKGTGVLYVRRGVALPNFITGGAQEMNRRAGTENVAGIVGFGTAITEAYVGLREKNEALLAKRGLITEYVLRLPRTRLNGDAETRLPGSLNFSFECIEGEALLLNLDLEGIACSSGSACTSGSLDPSHVLLSIGLPTEVAHGSLRVTMSKYTTDDEVRYFLEKLPPVVEKLRAMSPLWSD